MSTCRPSLLGMCISVDDEVRMINSVKLNQNSAIRRRYRFDTLLLFSPAPLLPTLESRRCIALCQSHRYLVALLVLPFVCLSYHSMLLSNSETLTQKLQLKKRQLRRSNWKVLTGYRPKTSNASEPFPHTKSKPLPTARSLSGCFWSAEREFSVRNLSRNLEALRPYCELIQRAVQWSIASQRSAYQRA